MSFKPRSQQRYFEYLERKGKMPKKPLQGLDDQYDDHDMPHMAHGGMMEEEQENYDYQMGHQDEFDSSGEPHTEDELEDEHPMEYMARGGMAKKKMSKGGMMMNRSKFIQALRKSR